MYSGSFFMNLMQAKVMIVGRQSVQ